MNGAVEHGLTEAERELLHRLKRIEGQVRGLQRMIEERRSCDEVVIQIAALREAINQVGMGMVGKFLGECLVERSTADPERDRAAVERALEILRKLT